MKFFHKLLLRFYKEESAQALILCAIVLPVLLAFAAIAIDIGVLRYQQEQLQSVADAAALSGALELTYCSAADCTAMTTAATQAVKENGYKSVTLNTQCGTTTSTTGITLTINNGPCELASDPNSGNTGYVEAVVTENEPTYFARIFGIKSENISARAEAARGPSPYCIYLSTKNTGSGGGNVLTVQGTGASLSASCGILDDSGGSPAFTVNSPGKVETTRNDVHGGDLLNNNPTVTPSVNTQVPAQPDPLSYLQPPPKGNCTSQSQTVNSGKGTTTLQPGTFCNGLTINSGATVTFSPGVYYMEGNMIIDGDTVTGNGVMFYFSSGSLTMNSNTHVDFVAPTTSDTDTGADAGILFYQNPSDTSSMILDSDSTSIFQGTIYAAGGQLTINAQGNLAAYTNIDVASLTNNATFSLGDDYSSLPGGDPIKGTTAVLSE